VAPSVVLLKRRRRGADARNMSRVRSLGPWLVPATLAAALSARAASRGDEALNDLPYFAQAAGGFGLDVYADPSLQVGPIWLVAIRVAGPALPWLVVAGGSALTALTLSRLAAGNPHRTLLAAGGTTLALVLGLPSFAYTSGHAAQLLVPLLWLNAYLDARRGRGVRAALLVGASAGLETWGLLGLPLLLALPLRAALRAAAGAIAVAAAVYLPFVLAGDFRMAEYRWTVADGTPVSLLVRGEFPWSLRFAQGVLAVAVGAVIVLASRRSVGGGVAAAGAVVAVRLLLDPERHGWYWIAAQLLAVALGIALAGAGLVVAREPVVRQRLPRRGVGDVLVPLRPDPGILVERAEPDADRRPVVGARPREQA
jgi:hypothetical protein